MRLVLLSDTHTFQSKVEVPAGDVLIHAGDLGLEGTVQEIQPALDWLNAQPHKHIVLIAGNHDWAFARKQPLTLGRILYLENSGIELGGVKFWGSPVQPEFCGWAFNVARGAAIKEYWDKIPTDTDVLITHGPPFGTLDQSRPGRSGSLGCRDLTNQLSAAKPRVHVFGHIHGGYGQTEKEGTNYFNASVVNELYRVVNQPHVFELEGGNGHEN